jgi:hypothetical protein
MKHYTLLGVCLLGYTAASSVAEETPDINDIDEAPAFYDEADAIAPRAFGWMQKHNYEEVTDDDDLSFWQNQEELSEDAPVHYYEHWQRAAEAFEAGINPINGLPVPGHKPGHKQGHTHGHKPKNNYFDNFDKPKHKHKHQGNHDKPHKQGVNPINGLPIHGDKHPKHKHSGHHKPGVNPINGLPAHSHKHHKQNHPGHAQPGVNPNPQPDGKKHKEHDPSGIVIVPVHPTATTSIDIPATLRTFPHLTKEPEVVTSYSATYYPDLGKPTSKDPEPTAVSVKIG